MVTKNGFAAHFLSTDLLSEKFGHPELLAAYGADSLPLFALTPNEQLRAPRIRYRRQARSGLDDHPLAQETDGQENGQARVGN